MKIKDALTQDISWSDIKRKFNELDHKYRIGQRINEFTQKNDVALRVILVFCFAFIVFGESWLADDAYHSYVMARHLAEGKGLVYNVGYRVNASTCPLMTLLTACIYMLIRNIEATGVFICAASSAAAAAVLFGKICKKFGCVIFAFWAMIMSYSFMSFTASGLENSLLFLLGSLFLSKYFSKDVFNGTDLYVLAFLLALLAMTRMDTVLIFIPMIVNVYLFKTKICWSKRFALGFLGLLPFILWEMFSLFYYGFPFPNTLYAKVFSGYPWTDYLVKGFTYLYISFMYDALLIIIPSLFLGLLIYWRDKKSALLFAGILIYTVYIVRIGGDFMAGRHLTLNFFLSLCGICSMLSTYQSMPIIKSEKIHLFQNKKVHHKLTPGMAAVCSLGICLILSPCLKPIAEMNFSIAFNSSLSGIVDEKRYYITNGEGTVDLIKTRLANQTDKIRLFWNDVFMQMEQSCRNGDKGFLNPDTLAFGYVVYYMADMTDMYLTDRCALMDPLLVRVPCIHTKHWRIGHSLRIIPDGYIESVRTGQNLIVDPSLHEYYDKMLIVITGDLFDIERLKTIWNMNTGQYDYLLEAYKTTITK